MFTSGNDQEFAAAWQRERTRGDRFARLHVWFSVAVAVFTVLYLSWHVMVREPVPPSPTPEPIEFHEFSGGTADGVGGRDPSSVGFGANTPYFNGPECPTEDSHGCFINFG